jgi:hypothetical protein
MFPDGLLEVDVFGIISLARDKAALSTSCAHKGFGSPAFMIKFKITAHVVSLVDIENNVLSESLSPYIFVSLFMLPPRPNSYQTRGWRGRSSIGYDTPEDSKRLIIL